MCHLCNYRNGTIAPPGNIIIKNKYVTLTHIAPPEGFPGWILLYPARHVEKQTELTSEEKNKIVSIRWYCIEVLENLTKTDRVYEILFSEKTKHIHYHLIPRKNTVPDAFRGGRILEFRETYTEKEIAEFMTVFRERIISLAEFRDEQ